MNSVVYLHGFASSPASSKARFFRQRLQAAGIPVEIPDLAAGDFEHLTLSGQLAVLHQHVGQGPVSLAGSSMGGYLAALYAARHPDSVRKLVLFAPAFNFAARWTDSLGPAKVDAWQQHGTIEVFHYGENRPRALAYDLLADARQYEPWPHFEQPVLIFHGAHDPVVPVSYSERFAATHPNARLEILNSGHELTDVVESMAPAVIDFLR